MSFLDSFRAVRELRAPGPAAAVQANDLIARRHQATQQEDASEGDDGHELLQRGQEEAHRQAFQA